MPACTAADATPENFPRTPKTLYCSRADVNDGCEFPKQSTDLVTDHLFPERPLHGGDPMRKGAIHGPWLRIAAIRPQELVLQVRRISSTQQKLVGPDVSVPRYDSD